MDTNEIAKDIVIALIEQKSLTNASSACKAYREIFQTVENPYADPTTN